MKTPERKSAAQHQSIMSCCPARAKYPTTTAAADLARRRRICHSRQLGLTMYIHDIEGGNMGSVDRVVEAWVAAWWPGER